MKTLIKIITMFVVSFPLYAQIVPTYVVTTPSTIQPSCRSWTGCGAIIVVPPSRSYVRPQVRRHFVRHYCHDGVTYSVSKSICSTPCPACEE